MLFRCRAITDVARSGSALRADRRRRSMRTPCSAPGGLAYELPRLPFFALSRLLEPAVADRGRRRGSATRARQLPPSLAVEAEPVPGGADQRGEKEAARPPLGRRPLTSGERRSPPCSLAENGAARRPPARRKGDRDARALRKLQDLRRAAGAPAGDMLARRRHRDSPSRRCATTLERPAAGANKRLLALQPGTQLN